MDANEQALEYLAATNQTTQLAAAVASLQSILQQLSALMGR